MFVEMTLIYSICIMYECIYDSLYSFALTTVSIIPDNSRRCQSEMIFACRHGQNMVDKAVANMQKLMDSKQLQEGQYIFLKYLLGRNELSYKDISMMALSLFYDGIQTVSSSEHLRIYNIQYRIFS